MPEIVEILGSLAKIHLGACCILEFGVVLIESHADFLFQFSDHARFHIIS